MGREGKGRKEREKEGERKTTPRHMVDHVRVGLSVPPRSHVFDSREEIYRNLVNRQNLDTNKRATK